MNEDSWLEAAYEDRFYCPDDLETEMDDDSHLEDDEPVEPAEPAEPDESMDGDFDSAMASAGLGTDEDYGYYGGED